MPSLEEYKSIYAKLSDVKLFELNKEFSNLSEDAQQILKNEIARREINLPEMAAKIYDQCPNCSKSLKGFFSVELIPQSKINFINKFTSAQKEAYCTNCSTPLLANIAKNFSQQKNDIETRLKKIIHFIPILTSPPPINWDYEVLEMITAQTTSGTGFLTEFSQSFNDIFGSTSNTTNKKIISATNFCKSNLRIQCVLLGGNAIISTDIDFNEVGSGSANMLMVCMAGTAIKVNNLNNFDAKKRAIISEIVELTEKLEAIAEMKQ